MEFVNAKFIYAVEVDTSEGFELCPADECQIDSNCPTGTAPKFTILNDFKLRNLSAYEAFLCDNNIGIAGIEIITDEDGVVWTYDVNTNTNYNSAAEEEANRKAAEAAAAKAAADTEARRIAEEEAISSVLAQNKYNLIRRRLNMDLTVCGIAAAKTSFNTAEGVTVKYVDPSYLIYSYTEDPNFEDIYYA